MEKKLYILLLLLAAVFVEPKAQGLRLQFHHLVDKQQLQLDTAQYVNAMGEAMQVSRFRYYISNIVLFKNGKPVKQPGYFLVDEATATSKSIRLKNIPAAIYDSIQFIVGVDSARNCSGAQTGALDPLKGMYWTWKSGYIFLKLEGHSSASSLRANLFEYHIGGYKAPANCIRTVRLPLPPAAKQVIGINVDLSQLFGNTVTITSLPSVTGIEHATEVADRIPGMFSIQP